MVVNQSKQRHRGNNMSIECPSCKRPFTFKSDNEALSSIGKNFGVLALLEAMQKTLQEQKKKEEELMRQQ